MYYSQELIEEIRAQNDIVDVIGSYVKLKQKGSSYFGLCPFHKEKTASFSVNAERQFYYCFGCGAAGNVISFIMQIQNCDFNEALKFLADRVHIELPEGDALRKTNAIAKKNERLFEMHKLAGRFFYETLHSPEGKDAVSYVEGRKVSEGIQKKFGLGFAPDSKDKLYKFLSEKGFGDEECLASGLVLTNKYGNGMRDRFYNRLMFPIFDVNGRIVGFGGRSIDASMPKYLNSPETSIFNKSKNLYGLNFAKKTRFREIILVEGYMDAISIYQAGYHNVSATLGTALNQNHASVLKKYADSVILLYDSDEAGTNAALRALSILNSSGFKVKVLQVTGGKDPDEYIKEFGSKEFGRLLVSAKSHVDFQIKCAGKKYDLARTDDKIKYTTDVALILSNLQTEIEEEAYIKDASLLTGISQGAIKSEINKIKASKDLNITRFEVVNGPRLKSSYRSFEKKNKKALNEAQKDVLNICSINRDIFDKIKEYVKPDDFFDIYRNLAEIVFELCEKKQAVFPGEVLNHFEDPSDQQQVAEVFASDCEYETFRDLERAVNDDIKIIKKANIDAAAENPSSIDEIYNLNKERVKLEALYITLSDG
ncbi:MAG: DNA primase [Lachnospiraceae bacterium]|nr:DNA primase [Lachnospiraceae bacterium]